MFAVGLVGQILPIPVDARGYPRRVPGLLVLQLRDAILGIRGVCVVGIPGEELLVRNNRVADRRFRPLSARRVTGNDADRAANDETETSTVNRELLGLCRLSLMAFTMHPAGKSSGPDGRVESHGQFGVDFSA
jgi:hypothetical protein